MLRIINLLNKYPDKGAYTHHNQYYFCKNRKQAEVNSSMFFLKIISAAYLVFNFQSGLNSQKFNKY
jgi:hypothetical protein